MKIRVFVVEDELIHLENMKLALQEAGFELAGNCDNADFAFDQIQKVLPHVVLIDIALPGINNGITLAQKIHTDLGIPHIFTTSFTQHEIIEQAVATNPSGYLKKPVDSTNLKAAIDIALKKSSKSITSSETIENEQLLFTKIGNKLVKIPIDQIEYIKADGDNFICVFFQNREVACRLTLKEFHAQLPLNFIQVHRAYIVNVNSITEINEKDQVLFLNQIPIPIGRKYKKALYDLFRKI